MSDDKISLDFLGEQMLRMQADLRGVRSEQVKMESEQASIRADVRNLDIKIDRVDAKVHRVDAKVDRVNANVVSLDEKVENLGRSMDARFAQVNETAASNLDIVLKAIEANRT
jgi:peptidoglycan hydrolase CwlO-like protein